MLPSPAKFHYIFNLRELARVFQGILRVSLKEVATGTMLTHLWRHECQRVFMDKLVTDEDKQAFQGKLDATSAELLNGSPAEVGVCERWNVDHFDTKAL